MITDDMIEAGARAIHRAATKCDPHDAERRWRRANELNQSRYRNEARECLRAAMEANNELTR